MAIDVASGPIFDDCMFNNNIASSDGTYSYCGGRPLMLVWRCWVMKTTDKLKNKAKS